MFAQETPSPGIWVGDQYHSHERPVGPMVQPPDHLDQVYREHPSGAGPLHQSHSSSVNALTCSHIPHVRNEPVCENSSTVRTTALWEALQTANTYLALPKA
jgi:hypothetical protein